MSKYRDALPQLGDEMFLTDGGMETTLIFHQGHQLPEFAAFDLYRQGKEQAYEEYYRAYLETAAEQGVGFILETATWRANPEWATKIGYSPAELDEVNRRSVADLLALRAQQETAERQFVVSGAIGPRGDGYVPSKRMTADEAEAYHAPQVRAFATAGADVATTFTLNYSEEALGVLRAAERVGLPVVIGLTVETDGKLPSGQSLPEAIQQLDAASGGYASYYMINCAHPTHFAHALQPDEAWTRRIRALRCNASAKSHAELDEATELDPGNPAELGQQCAELKRLLPAITVFGGCCGTDHRHVAEIAKACAPLFG